MIKRKQLHKKRRKSHSKIVIKRKLNKLPREQFVPSDGISITYLKNEVLKMQYELAVVVRDLDKDRVIHLTKKILRSKLAQEYAVYRTISSTGSRTKGVYDITKLRTRVQYDNLRLQIWETIKNPNKYKASPLKRIWLPKPNSVDYRPISVPGYLDRALQHLHLLVVDVLFEESADNNSFGFRPFRSPGWAAKALTLQIWSRKSFNPPKYAIELDIRKCFDSISHDFIKDLVSKYPFKDINIQLIHPLIIEQWLKCGYIDVKGLFSPKDQIIPTESGIPQGGPISPAIANRVLDGLEAYISKNIPTPQNLQYITEKDKIVWSFEGKEILCTTNIPIEETTLINAAFRKLGYNPPKGMAKQFYLGNWINSRGSWTYKAMNDESGLTINRRIINDQYSFLVRYADDALILVNTLETGNLIIDKIKEFLKPRGLGINDKKTYIKDLYNGDKISFVGFEFSIQKDKGTWSVYNYPPANKISNVKAKVDKIFKIHKYKPYNAFYLANSTLRGWLNFYRTANSKMSFQKINEWLFKRTYQYLTQYLKANPKYRIKSQKHNMKLLGYDLWNNFRFPSISSENTKWFGIPKELNPNVRWSSLDAPPYMLIEPKFVEVSTPSIIVGKSSYHPTDRIELIQKALYWKVGLHKALLIKQKGLCKLCNCSLLDPYEDIEIHHIKPLKFNGPKKFTNLAALCKECHKLVTLSIKNRNLDQIIYYEQTKILQNVSDILIAEHEMSQNKSDGYTGVENST